MDGFRGRCRDCRRVSVLDMPPPHGRCPRCEPKYEEEYEEPPPYYEPNYQSPRVLFPTEYYFNMLFVLVIAGLIVELIKAAMR